MADRVTVTELRTLAAAASALADEAAGSASTLAADPSLERSAVLGSQLDTAASCFGDAAAAITNLADALAAVDTNADLSILCQLPDPVCPDHGVPLPPADNPLPTLRCPVDGQEWRLGQRSPCPDPVVFEVTDGEEETLVCRPHASAIQVASPTARLRSLAVAP